MASKISFGSHYNRYLNSNNFNSVKLETKNPEYKETYRIANLKNCPIFKGVLCILHDGRAIFKANYTSYSGVKNKYENYFNLDGLEIIHIGDSTREEKKYFNNLAD